MIEYQFHSTPAKGMPVGINQALPTSTYISGEKQHQADDLRNQTASQKSRPHEHDEQSLFDRRAELKKSLRMIAMHLSPDYVEKIFSQIDYLLDDELFDEDCSTISIKSFELFVRYLCFGFLLIPRLTVTPNANLMASWKNPEGEIHVEFLDDDRINTMAVRKSKDEPEYFSHLGTIKSQHRFLGNITIKHWCYHT